LVYIAFVTISAIASSYNHTAWFGTREREEGAFMWMVYFIVFFAAMFYVRAPKYTKPILFGLAFSSVFMGAIGVSQLIGRDFFATNFGAGLVVLGIPNVESVRPNFTIAYGTLYNPNTFGKYSAMVAPVLLIAGFIYKGKLFAKLFIILSGVLMLVGVFASGSLGGLIGISSATGVLIITYICGLFAKGRHNVVRVGLAFSGIAIATALAVLLVPPLNYRATTLFSRLREAAAAETITAERYIFDGNNIFVYSGPNRLFTLTVNSLDSHTIHDWVVIRDALGQDVAYGRIPPTATEPATYTFSVPGARDVTMRRSAGLVEIMPHGQILPFWLTLEEGRLYGMRGSNAPLTDINAYVPSRGFEGRETWGSSRGYIWSRSFPLMPRRTIIGSGPDTFINIFPHHDMSGLQLAFNNPYQIVDKAHNLFIQTWLTTGGISAIALFALFAHYLLTSFWGIVKSRGEDTQLYGIRLGLLAGISGFIMAGMATDSTIGSTGVFFVLLGMGYGINAFLKKQQGEGP